MIVHEVELVRQFYARQVERVRLLPEEARLLALAANGQLQRDPETLETIRHLVQDLLEWLFGAPKKPYFTAIPIEFWSQPGLGELLAHVQAWLSHDDWISYTEAARRLYAGEMLSPDAALARIRRLVERGTLLRYRNPDGRNEQHASRVSAQAVNQLIHQKQGED